MVNNILILPSWYATADAPTSGSFFHEQSILLEDETIGEFSWNVHVLTTEKDWISRQRSWYYRLFPNRISYTSVPQFLTPPSGAVVRFPFCKFNSDALNLHREVAALIHYFQVHPEKKPALIHAHDALKGGVLARSLAQKLGIPYVVSVHMNPFLLHNYSDFWKNEIIRCLENASAVLAVSEHQRQHLLMHEIRCNPIVTGNLVDETRFTLPNPPESKQVVDFLIVTYYPNFIKDMDTFFDALLLLKESNQLEGKRFTIVGGGELSGELEENYYQKKINQFGLTAWTKIVPKANRDEMKNLMQQTDVLISTSIAESFGVAICEALLCGKPVVSTRNGGVNDFLDDRNSIQIPIKNPVALHQAILQMCEVVGQFDRSLLRAGIVEKYGRKVFRERMEGIYKQHIL
jgi:glycosyltransferase involved in cell wall biosynthesis